MPIPGYEGLYATQGDKVISLRSGSPLKTGFAGSINRRYLSVSLYLPGSSPKKMLVHRAVLSSKLGRPIAEGMVVDHIDNNSLNNFPENLRELNPAENTQAGYDLMRIAGKTSTLHRGVYKHNNGYSIELRIEEIKLYVGYSTDYDIACKMADDAFAGILPPKAQARLEKLKLKKKPKQMRSNRKYVIILDEAHGCDVAGKRSADGSFLEWQWSREQLRLIEADLLNLGFAVTTSNNWADNEIGLSRRVANMNAVTGPAIVLSYHANACTMTGEGGKATGTVAYTTRGVTRSDAMADIFLAKVRQYFPDRRILKDFSDGDGDWEANFTVLTSKWPSVLIEVGFMDNEDDLKLLKSEDWNKVMRAAIVDAIVQIDREV